MILLPQWINHVYVQIAFTLVVFPCLLLAYTGQAAYIIDHKDHVADAFYRSIPGPTELSKNLILLISRYHTTISCPICTNWHSACRTTLCTLVLCALWYAQFEMLYYCRTHILASLHHSNSCSCSRKSSNHICYLLNNKASSCTGLFPPCQCCPYLKEISGADLHPWHQLGTYDSLHCCDCWIQEPKPDRKCIRWAFLIEFPCFFRCKMILPPSQITIHFDFSKYIAFAMHLDITFV